MKTIITVFLLFLISVTALSMEGFHKGDTIRYKFDKMLIEVASTRVTRNIVPLKGHNNSIKQIQKVLAELSITEPAMDERVTIIIREFDEDMHIWNYKEVELTRTKQNKKVLVVFNDGTTFEKDFGRYCVYLLGRTTEMKIWVDQLSDLDLLFSKSFSKKTEQASTYLSEKFGEKERKRIVGWLDLRGDKVNAHFIDRGMHSQDMLILSAGIGSGWVKNTFVSDINFRVGFTFGNKGMFKNIYAIDYSMMYDFSESNENKFYELNHFVSLAWEHNFSNTLDKDKWYGFSVGYLVKRNNDFFKKNTFKVGVNKKINDTFIIKPELYFNDFFKNVYPGVRLSVAF